MSPSTCLTISVEPRKRRNRGRNRRGVPYDQVVTTLNNDFNPFTAFDAVEGPIGQDIENLLVATGIQQDLLDPILGLFGPLGGLFTS